ncbi:thioredoxin domain-containing protein [bacterium]|nr:thioredoxin domain-containing protein [bacterium]
MNIDKKNIAIQILAIIGLGLAIDLAFIYYTAVFDKYALPSFCSINEFVDCDGAARSNYAQFLGIPLAYWGIFFYLTILFLTVVDKLKKCKFLKFLEVFKDPKAYISTLGAIAFACSMILAGISLFKIHKICILCLVTYFINLIIALVASGFNSKNFLTGIKTTFFDFIDGVKKYTKTFIVLLLLFSGFLAYSGISLDFVPHIKRSKAFTKYRKMKKNPYRINGNILGNPNGDIVIELYSDYVCPLCYIQNIMLHQAVKEYKNIRVNHNNIPFDKACNSYITINMHPNACFMSKAALAAKKQGDYWGMSSLLYENQPKSTAKLDKLIEELNLDKDKFYKDFYSDEISNTLNKDVEKASLELEIDATPTMFINGERIVGIKPYYELKKLLEDNGAKRK